MTDPKPAAYAPMLPLVALHLTIAPVQVELTTPDDFPIDSAARPGDAAYGIVECCPLGPFCLPTAIELSSPEG